MTTTIFLTDERLWERLWATIKAARRVEAAIAYFGQDGAKLLPLRPGDRLVVDMSPGTVRAGGTDPREIEKLLQRGVQVFTRRNLHAKVIIADSAVIAGSANISRHSRQSLDEAAILTDDPAVVRRAREFVNRICTEPVRPIYLKECKKIYKPPRPHVEKKPIDSVAKLWVIHLEEGDIPEEELPRFERGKRRAAKRVRDKNQFETDSFWETYRSSLVRGLKVGDWIVQVLTSQDGSVMVYPPGQLLLLDIYARRNGKKRYVFHIEVPKRGQRYRWVDFRRKARRILASQLTKPRTIPIRDPLKADALLSLWTASGYLRRSNP